MPYILSLPAVEADPLTDLGSFRHFWSHSMTRTDDGALLACGYASDAPEARTNLGLTPKERQTAVFLQSEDEGRSWRYLSHIPNPHAFSFTESGLLAGRNKRVVLLLRVDWDFIPKEQRPEAAQVGYGYYLYQAEPKDNGQTWSKPVQLRSGEILLTYGHRRPPYEVRAILSHDMGKNWDTQTLRVLKRFDLGNYDFGYPQATQLNDGTIVCTYYGYTTNRAAG